MELDGALGVGIDGVRGDVETFEEFDGGVGFGGWKRELEFEARGDVRAVGEGVVVVVEVGDAETACVVRVRASVVLPSEVCACRQGPKVASRVAVEGPDDSAIFVDEVRAPGVPAVDEVVVIADGDDGVDVEPVPWCGLVQACAA